MPTRTSFTLLGALPGKLLCVTTTRTIPKKDVVALFPICSSFSPKRRRWSTKKKTTQLAGTNTRPSMETKFSPFFILFIFPFFLFFLLESRVIIIIITVITEAHWSFVSVLLASNGAGALLPLYAATAAQRSGYFTVEIMSVIRIVVVPSSFFLPCWRRTI